MALFGRRHKNEGKLSRSSVTSSSVDIAIRPKEEENTYLKSAGAYYDIRDKGQVSQLREKIRRYSIYDSTLSTIIMLTSMFVSSGAKIVCEDKENEDRLNAFFKSCKMQDFIQDFVKEYLISGEATSFASWNDGANAFTTEQILNPDQISVMPSLFEEDDYIAISIPAAMQEVFDDPSNPDHDDAISQFKDVYNQSSSGLKMNVNSDKIIRIVNKTTPWDDFGIPVFASALSALVQKESLDAALYEQLSTLITPTIIGTVGLKSGELGAGAPPWIPNQQELDQIRDAYRTMMMARFRLGLFTIGVDFKNAFAGAQIPNLNNDYERCDQQILRCIAAGRGLLDGSAGGPFASNAINRDVYSSVIQSIRDKVAQAYQKRIDSAIRHLKIYAYRPDATGMRSIVTTANGHYVYESAFLDFDHGVMRNANDALQTALDLAKADVPISKQTLADLSESGIQVAQEIRTIKKENDLANKVSDDTSDLNGDIDSSVGNNKELKSPLDKRNF